MKFALATLAAAVLCFANSASAAVGTFDPVSVPETITSMDITVFNLSAEDGCTDSKGECFRIAIVLNGEQVAQWMASPGTPNHSDYGGVYTPNWEQKSFNTSRIYNSYTNSHGDSMPYAMFVGSTGIAVHASGKVTGNRLSHGCIRVSLEHAKTINQWMREAVKNGDTPTLTTRGTRP
jgi:lipoprotein-anchoring transpeptidase ErfK/SrfK